MKDKILKPYEKYQTKREEIAKKLWFRCLNQFLNLCLALGTVLPMLYYICRTIPFTYEVNDDAGIAMILDGSYTGVPDGHSIFVKYPWSGIIRSLYSRNLSVRIPGFGSFSAIHLEDINWYVGTIVLLEGFALVVVLYRLLNHFRCNRFLICLLYGVGFVEIWLSCFSEMTFSTAAAFMGCMSLLYLALEDREEAWRPWNLAILCILMTASYSLRPNCFYMVAPFLAVEFGMKYHIFFFKTWKPWFAGALILLVAFGTLQMNQRAYGSQDWKDFFAYNHERAYLQDYKGFPDYEKNKEFYHSIGINEVEEQAMAVYSYGLVDSFSPEWVEKTYDFVKKQEITKSWREKIQDSQEKAWKYASQMKQAPLMMRFFGFYLWLILPPLMLVSLIFRGKEGIFEPIRHIFQTLCYGILLAAEWIYLAIHDRFPQRVEESIRLLMVTAALVMICHLLKHFQERWVCRLHGIVQILVIVLLLPLLSSPVREVYENVKGRQEHAQIAQGQKGEILEYCGQHPENFYVLDTCSFLDGSLPSDKTNQMNWITSASWVAYSPLYQQKLQKLGTEGIASSFLLRENVYLITKGKKSVESRMGLQKGQVSYEIVDEYCSSSNAFYEIYKIREVNVDEEN